MKLMFLGAAHEVTGSCTLLTACGHNILIDCGMEQGPDTFLNSDIPVAPGEIDCVLLTHAHIDHSGKLPLLSANGFDGPIYSTKATSKLCSIMLLDSAHIQEFEAEWRNRKAKRAGSHPYTPLYTTEDAQKCITRFVGCDYQKVYKIFDGISISFMDAGHLLGSSSIIISVTENGKTQKLLFSGDIGNIDRPLIRDPSTPPPVDYLVIESTYGDRLHGERPDYVAQLSKILDETFAGGGNVVIPSFAVGRTQELLYIIREIKQKGLVNSVPDFTVYVDSPLAVETTHIYRNDMTEYYDEETLKLVKNGINPLYFDGLKVAVTSDESRMINFDNNPKVIISASGMCEAGRIRHHLKHNLWKAESTVLFVGYQAVGTLGRAITEGAKEVKLFGESIQVKAHIEQLAGISGHADRDRLLEYAFSAAKGAKQVFVNHGNDLVTEDFAKLISEKLGVKTAAPYSGSIYDLDSGLCLAQGNTEYIEKPNKNNSFAASPAFDRLTEAGKKLQLIIGKNRGAANKDLAKFADQILAVCEKWDR